MDAINRAGINGLLNPFKAVAVLTYYPRSAPIWLHQKGIACHMGAIPTANTNLFINPYGLLAQAAPQQGFFTCISLARSRQWRRCKGN
jgi:hypothetical protein